MEDQGRMNRINLMINFKVHQHLMAGSSPASSITIKKDTKI